jgi:hypothetical protein
MIEELSAIEARRFQPVKRQDPNNSTVSCIGQKWTLFCMIVEVSTNDLFCVAFCILGIQMV